MWNSEVQHMNPDLVLSAAADRADVVQGLVPQSGIAWMYGASMSYKTFAAMSLAVAVSRGADWCGRKTNNCAVVYVGAEGGAALHLRRAAAEMDAGAAGALALVQERPLLDTPQGAARLQGILEGIAGATFYDQYMSDVEADTIRDSAASRYDIGVEAQDDIRDRTDGSVLCIIDTYSQTSNGDDKSNVAAYIKNLRDIIENAPCPVSFIVVDHATKAGGSYMGSVAKLNDVDSQLEVLRVGDNAATVYQRKVKDGVESAPIALQLVPVALEQYRDAYGSPLATLVVREGSKGGKLVDGKAAVLLGILKAKGGSASDLELRSAFAAHASNEGIKAESVGKAYRRARESLFDADLVSDEGGSITLT